MMGCVCVWVSELLADSDGSSDENSCDGKIVSHGLAVIVVFAGSG